MTEKKTVPYRKLSPTSPATGLGECSAHDAHMARTRAGGVYATGWQAVCVDRAKRKISRTAKRLRKTQEAQQDA